MSNQIEFRHWTYFLAVAEELHFGKAAELLYISQPGLSRQIKQLEALLGILLFERDNRNVQLTEAGKYLHTEVSLNLKKLDSIVEQAQLIHQGIIGKLRFGYLGSAMQNIIPDLLLKFRKIHPNVHFDLGEMENLDQVENLLNQDIDLGFVRLEQVPSELVRKPVFEDTFSLVLPKAHPLTPSTFEGLEQLREETFILFEKSYSSTYYDKIMQIFYYSGFNPKVTHSSVHASTIYRLVENHFGISIVPTSLQMGYSMNVKFIELKDIPQRTTLSAVWNRYNKNPMLKEIILLLQKVSPL